MAQHTMTFEVENGITKAKIDGVYVGAGKSAKFGVDEEEVKKIIANTVIIMLIILIFFITTISFVLILKLFFITSKCVTFRCNIYIYNLFINI